MLASMAVLTALLVTATGVAAAAVQLPGVDPDQRGVGLGGLVLIPLPCHRGEVADADWRELDQVSTRREPADDVLAPQPGSGQPGTAGSRYGNGTDTDPRIGSRCSVAVDAAGDRTHSGKRDADASGRRRSGDCHALLDHHTLAETGIPAGGEVVAARPQMRQPVVAILVGGHSTADLVACGIDGEDRTKAARRPSCRGR